MTHASLRAGLRATLFFTALLGMWSLGSIWLATPAAPLAFAQPLAAQESLPLRLSVDSASGEPRFALEDLFDDPGLRQALHEGLPLRLSLNVALWRDRFFDSQVASDTWSARLLWDELSRTYLVSVGSSDVTAARDLAEAGDQLQQAITVDVRPREAGRHYYLVDFEVETLSLSDIEELERWLRGEVTPSPGDAGGGDIESALARGVQRLLVRALGLPTRRLRLRSETFEFAGG